MLPSDERMPTAHDGADASADAGPSDLTCLPDTTYRQMQETAQASSGYAESGRPATPIAEETASAPQHPSAKPPARSKMRTWVLVIAAAVVGGLVGAATTGGAFYTLVAPQLAAEETAVDPATDGGVVPAVNIDVADEDPSFAEAVAMKVTPSVVSVAIEQTGFNPFTRQPTTQVVGNGSGVIIRSDGYILTNNHVISGADGITVTIGVEDLPAEVVGSDPSTDLAVLKVDRTGLPAIELGSSADLRVGQPVVAVGSPFGLDQSVTTGIVSALGRTSFSESAEAALTTYTSLIQTDAAINPGNSGGALTDARGRLIGINTLIQTGSQYANQSAGVGFAIPIDYAMAIAEELIDTGVAHHPYMGISSLTISEQVAARYELPVDAGILVASVASGSPAEAAGIKAGDIIVKIGDADIASVEDFFIAIRLHEIGDRVPVQIVRDAEEVMLNVILGSDTSS